MSLPLVSYIIITMNRQDELALCLTSLQKQDYPRKEILVVDNGSSDGTPKMLREQFPEIVLVALKTNQGVPGGRNRGIEAAKGDICFFVDDDGQLLDPQATRRIVSYFQKDVGIAGVTFLVRNAFTGLEELQAIPRVDKRVINEDYFCSYFPGGAVAIKRPALVETGMLWEKLQPYGGEDLDLGYRLLDKGYRIIRTNSIELSHRRIPEGEVQGRWVYFNARNRCWIAVRNLPWIYAIGTSLVWWSRTALISLKQRCFGSFVLGMRDAIRGIPAVLVSVGPSAKQRCKALKNYQGGYGIDCFLEIRKDWRYYHIWMYRERFLCKEREETT